MTEADAPEMRLYSPCLCRGSQALVHEECLNTWRQTSAEAYSHCSVCKHKYVVERSALAGWASSWFVCTAVSTVVLFCVILLLGLAIMKFCEVLQLDLIGRGVKFFDAYDVRLRQCRFARRQYSKHRSEFRLFFEHFYTDSLDNFVRDACAGGGGFDHALQECATSGYFTPASVAQNPSELIEFVSKVAKQRPHQLLDAMWEYFTHWLVRFGLSAFDFSDQCVLNIVCSPRALLFCDSLIMGVFWVGLCAVVGNVGSLVVRLVQNRPWDEMVMHELRSLFVSLIGVFGIFRDYRGVYCASQIIGGVFAVFHMIHEYILRKGKEHALSNGENIRPVSSAVA